MATRTAKIVLYQEGIDGMGLAEDSVTSAKTVDAFEVMQTDFEPEEKTVQVNSEGSFFVANLTATEAKKLASSPEVLDVVDDIKVYALQEENPFDSAEGFGTLDLPAEDVEALEADPYPEWDPDTADEDPMLTAEQLNLLTMREPDMTEDIELEALIEGTAEASAEQIEISGIPNKKLIGLLKCAIKCALQEKGSSAEDISKESIAAALRAVGLSDDASAQASDVILPNLRVIYAPWSWRYSTGNGVRVAIVDTGIDPRHPDLRVHGGISFVPGVSSWRDDQGHGTHCAGITAALWNGRGIVGVAPQARLYAVKVLNKQGSGQLSWILNGLMACYRAGMHVINLSLGSNVNTHDPRVYNAAYEHVGRILRQRGILCVAAAGNNYHRPVGNPARCPSFMAVSAIDNQRRLTTFTSVGPQVEICAPGYQILSTVPGGGYARKSGTSMSAPHVTGVAALVKARHPSAHGDSIRVHLWRTALDIGSPGRDWAFGYGQVNALRAAR